MSNSKFQFHRRKQQHGLHVVDEFDEGRMAAEWWSERHGIHGEQFTNYTSFSCPDSIATPQNHKQIQMTFRGVIV